MTLRLYERIGLQADSLKIYMVKLANNYYGLDYTILLRHKRWCKTDVEKGKSIVR